MTEIRLGIAGLGTVAQGVLELIRRNNALMQQRSGVSLRVVRVASRRAKPEVDLQGAQFSTEIDDLLTDPNVDMILELIGGDTVALELIRRALAANKPVVTANKAVLAAHGNELMSGHGQQLLRFEAAVAGAIPIIQGMSGGLAANRLASLFGIINGTCNYIFGEMEANGTAFDEVLAEAQRLGYAEAEPSFDVDGIDAAHKLTILAAIAFGQKPDFAAALVQGIRDVSAVDFTFANQLGFRIKLVGVAAPGQVPRMQTCLLPLSSQLAKVNGVLNAVEFYGEPVGSVLAIGPGAGGGATSSAVLADIIDVAHDRGGMPFGRPVAQLADTTDQPGAGLADTPFYVRLMVVDEPGVLAGVTGILQKHMISVESMIQQGRAPGDVVALVMTTHEIASTKLWQALDEMTSLPSVKARPVAMPIFAADQEG